MDLLKKLVEKFSLRSGIINSIMGIALFISLIFIYRNPNNQAAVLTASFTCGVMNIMNGLKLIKDPKKSSTGMSFIMMGIVLIVLGFIINHIVEGA